MSGFDEGRIITFYSYKGGTGRTMALANTAWILASCGYRVLVVDWDLEAPGLDRFLHPFLSESKLRSTPGVLELVSRSTQFMPEGQYAARGATSSSVIGERIGAESDGIPLAQCLIPVAWRFPGGGLLDYLAAGTKDKGYLSAFSQFDWKPFLEGPLATRFLEELKREFVENYDYVLVDSRTGLSDISDICTVSLPHTLVTCFTPSNQSIEGAASVAERIESLYGNRNIRILPVPMRVENAEADRLDAARGLFQYRFDRIVRKHVGELEPDDYWGRVEIPYRPIYSYEETLAPFREPSGNPTSLLAAYERLTEVVSEGRVSTMPRIEDELRREILDRYTRQRPPRISDVYLSFVPADRNWAGWASAVLARSGFKVHLAEEGAVGAQPAEEIQRGVQSASHTLVILSESYLRSPRFRTTWEAAYEVGGLKGHRLVTMRVESVSLKAPFSDQVVDLTRCRTGDEGMAALLGAFGRRSDASTRDHFTAEESRLPRYPGAEPLIWNLPLRSSSFTGRTRLLEEVRGRLWSGRGLVLKGMGGVGKTLLAQEYAYRYKSDYDAVLFIPAEQRLLTLEALAGMAGPLGVPECTSPTDTARAVWAELSSGERYEDWLLIFDNAPGADCLPDFITPGRGHLLITSQRAEGWDRLGDTLEVPVFEREESIAHLSTRLPDCGDSEADPIAELLGDLPLAIEQAAAAMRQSGLAPRDYVELLRAHTAEDTGSRHGDRTAAEATGVTGTWEFAVAQLEKRFPPAVKLLQICSYFSPEPIAMDVLHGVEVTRVLGGAGALARACRELSRLSLLRVDRRARSVAVHRLVQAAMRERMTEAESQAARDVVHRSLVAARPAGDDPENPSTWEQYRIIWPHLDTPWARSTADEGMRELCVDRVRQLRRRGELAQALAYGRRCVDEWSASGSSEERWTLHMRFQIANVLRAQGNYTESLSLDQEVLERQLAVLDDRDDQHILMTTSSIGADLRGLGRLSEALHQDEETYRRYELIYGEDHPRTVSAANNLAVSLRLSGDYYRARDLDRRMLELREEMQSPEHPLTIESAVNLGRDLRDCGDYEESVRLLKGAYERCLRDARLAQGSPTVVNAAKGLAGSLRRVGRIAEAEELVRHLLESTSDGGYGVGNSERLLLEMGLAGDLAALGRGDEGSKLMRRVLGDMRVNLGHTHPWTTACSVNYAALLLGGRQPARRAIAEEARQMLREAQEEFARLNGDQHPYTLFCRADLSVAEAALDHWAEAHDTCCASYEQLTGTLGPTHPATLLCAGNLAIILKRLGSREQAETMHSDVLAALTDRIGENHPQVRNLRAWQFGCLDVDPHPI
ncbi:FxSxx-COOH system tetratricopeptide repeat protein [Streptomyces torulosus]|uniref:FxSxx-COOH system tetratricopeptide repeat protein n=1 Tax=Streptomyces torulosus TaxID=68276 RepID=UPI0006EBC6BC|nr:FxSxx-COOH system tetratricopeptide repeat protein [Streptomyces torulosus]